MYITIDQHVTHARAVRAFHRYTSRGITARKQCTSNTTVRFSDYPGSNRQTGDTYVPPTITARPSSGGVTHLCFSYAQIGWWRIELLFLFNVLLDHCNITSFSTVRHIHTHAGKQHRIVSGQKTNADDKVNMYYDDVYKLSDLTVRHSPFNRPRTLFAVRLMSAISCSNSSFISATATHVMTSSRHNSFR